MLTASSILLLVSPIVFLTIVWKRGDDSSREAEKVLVFLAYLLPAAILVVYALIWRLDATRVLLELRAVAFRSLSNAPVKKAIGEREVGRGRIVVGDLPQSEEKGRERLFGTLEFRPPLIRASRTFAPEAGRRSSPALAPRKRGEGGQRPGEGFVGSLTVQLPPPESRAGVIATEEEGIVGAEALHDGDRICIDSNCWTFDEDELSFAGGGSSVVIPPRQTRVPGFDRLFTLPFAPPLNARSRTYSLDWLAARGAVSYASDGNRVRSFLCHFEPRGLQLVLLDDNVTLLRGGKAVAIANQLRVQDGSRLSFFSLPNATEEFAGPGLTERRSVVYAAGARSFVLTLDTPETRSLTVEELRALALGIDSEREKQLSVGLSMGNAQTLDRSLYLSGLSESVALQASSLFELSTWFPRNLGSTFRVVSPRGPADATLGDVVWIGATDLAAIRFDVVRPPLVLLLLGLLVALLKYFAALRCRFTWRQTMYAAALECLVGIRLLIAYRAWAMPPHASEALDLGLIAWMTVPWLFLAASMTVRSSQRRPWAPIAAGLLLSLAFSWRVLEGRLLWVWCAMHILAVGAALGRARQAESSPRLRGEGRRSADEGLFKGVLVAAAVICLLRLLLLLTGSKEALMGGGGRVSLSALHIPAAVIVEGIFFFRVWQRAQKKGLTWSDIGVAFALLLLLWGIPAFATSDLGLALLNAPVFALLLVLMHRQTARVDWRRRMFIWLPAAAMCVVILLAPLGRFILPYVASDESMLELASDANYARFLHFAAPERLRDLATKRGESLAITSAILQSYIGSGLLGRGYGATEVTPLLGDTALRDFAPAVFVAAEWGLVGTTALLLIYGLFLVLGMRAAPWSERRSTAADAIECVAAATIAFCSIYMILANHELVLLTGKNAYLLGLDSAGDLVELVFLLFLIAYAAAWRRDTPSRQASILGGEG